MASNPTLDLDAPRVNKAPPHALLPEQVTALLHAPAEPNAKGLRDRAMLEVMYATGIRVTELVTRALLCYWAKAERTNPATSLQERD